MSELLLPSEADLDTALCLNVAGVCLCTPHLLPLLSTSPLNGCWAGVILWVE
jgi:hypothetical protein